MNSVKLIALDIDGTLYNKDGVITSYNKEMIRKAVENGITVIISTGRPYIGYRFKCPAVTQALYAVSSYRCLYQW